MKKIIENILKSKANYIFGLVDFCDRNILKWYSIVTFVLILFYLLCFNHVEQHEIGIRWNPFLAEATCEEPGLYLSAPWIRVSNIDTRPQKVSITTTANSYNSKLVSFDKEYFLEFVKTQGFSYYWLNNRYSFNLGYGEEYRGFKDILRGYAFGNKHYNFIKVEETF